MAKIAASYFNSNLPEPIDDWDAVDDRWDPEYPNQVPSQVFLVNRKDGRKIALSVESYRFNGKIEIRGVYNFGPSEYGVTLPSKYYPAPKINVGFDRGGVALAKAIISRFLPTYNEIVQSLAQTVSNIRAYREDQMAIVGQLATVVEEPRRGVRGSDYNSLLFKGGSAYISNGTVDLKLEGLSPRMARYVLEMMTTGNPQ
jgi:hypothetical protein